MNIKIHPLDKGAYNIECPVKGCYERQLGRCIKVTVKEDQRKFVPFVAVSLAKVYIKPDGDNVEYIPFAIYDGDLMVGFVMHAVVIETSDMYWINGFIIDQSQQGNGYGKAALQESIDIIKILLNRVKK